MSDFDTIMDSVMGPFMELHGDTVTHTAAATGTATSITLTIYELMGALDNRQELNFIAQASALEALSVTITEGDVITYNGGPYTIVKVEDSTDGTIRGQAFTPEPRA